MTYWKQIAIAIVIALVYGAGYYKGYSNQKVKFDAFKLEVKLNAELQKKQNELVVKKQESITAKVTKEYKDALSKLHAYYSKHPVIKWMPNSSTISGVSEVSNTPSQSNGETKGYQVDTSRVNPVDCASDVLQLLHLQKWVEQQTSQ